MTQALNLANLANSVNSSGQLAGSAVNGAVASATNATNATNLTGGTCTIGTTQLGPGNASTLKNRIINGAMVIDQRNAGASLTPTTNQQYTLDRWSANLSQSSKFSVQQNAGSITPPAGYTNYLGITSTSAYSVGANDYFGIFQKIEGFNVADLGFGTANAKTVTISFWVRSSLTGTFGGIINNSDGSRVYCFSYTISAANTWQQVTTTIAGDTGGTWQTTNSTGLTLNLCFGAGTNYVGATGFWTGSYYIGPTGQTSVVGTNGATFYITGVQLEVGSSATGFEYRQYGQELALCQRYFASFGFGSVGAAYASTALQVGSKLPMTMRAAPTLTITTTTPSFSFPAVGDKTGSGSTINYQQASTNGIRANVDGLSGLTANYVGISATDVFFASAEL